MTEIIYLCSKCSALLSVNCHGEFHKIACDNCGKRAKTKAYVYDATEQDEVK